MPTLKFEYRKNKQRVVGPHPYHLMTGIKNSRMFNTWAFECLKSLTCYELMADVATGNKFHTCLIRLDMT